MTCSMKQGALAKFVEANLAKLPRTDRFETFEDGEDPVAYVMRQFGSIYPTIYQDQSPSVAHAPTVHSSIDREGSVGRSLVGIGACLAEHLSDMQTTHQCRAQDGETELAGEHARIGSARNLD